MAFRASEKQETPQRRCTLCEKVYPATLKFFPSKAHGLYGLHSLCRSCKNLQQRKHYAARMQKPGAREKKREGQRKWDLSHLEQLRKSRRAYHKLHYNSTKETMRLYYTNDTFRTIFLLRSRLRHAIRRFSKGGKVGFAKDYGINYKEIAEHLGPRPGPDYHIDHIIPCCKFNHDDPEQVKKCWAPENLQWLPAKENLYKAGK